MLKQTIAVRIGHLERLEIEAAAARLCIGPTTFIRQAALAVARTQTRPPSAAPDNGAALPAHTSTDEVLDDDHN